jgi:hypothetical protein
MVAVSCLKINAAVRVARGFLRSVYIILRAHTLDPRDDAVVRVGGPLFRR